MIIRLVCLVHELDGWHFGILHVLLSDIGIPYRQSCPANIFVRTVEHKSDIPLSDKVYGLQMFCYKKCKRSFAWFLFLKVKGT